MKALILHGTGATPNSNWFPWLKQKLEEQGYEVWIPLLPDNHTPNRETYNDSLFGSGWDFTDNIVIGHSAGAVSVLNLLMDKRCPPVKIGVMVGAWAGNDFEPTPAQLKAYQQANFTREQFAGLFPWEGFDFERIKAKTDKLIFVHGDDDPYCPLEQAQCLAGKLDADIHIIPNGQHLGSTYKEFPKLLDIINSATI
ncbi:MAG TPA: alpha/beta fold hydrolase [Candidatus Limnocylindrales bacterium]|nr:alpha/beta fold hydrolase [Candidatus Limnocylindrales bacterium]